MNEAMKHDQAQTCPQCGNHCPVDALQCGRGRKYFGVTDGGHDGEHNHEHEHKHEHGHEHEHGCGCGHRQLGGLAGLLHQCGRYARHAELEEAELFQALTDEEKASLQVLLEKLTASWRERCGGEGLGHSHHHGHGDAKHHEHEGRGK